MTQVNRSLRPDLALVRVGGADARGFLHAQTTQHIDDMSHSEIQCAAWLSPKGRVQALFDVIPRNDDFWLATAADNAAWLADRLRIFVLRADVSIDVTPQIAICSVTGDVSGWLRQSGADLPIGTLQQRNGPIWYRLSASLLNVIGTTECLTDLLADVPPGDVEAAVASEIDAGRAEVSAAQRERQTAHMLNLDRLGAIAFDKGCYPGQEIVARTENLGQVKRRLFHLRIAGGEAPEPGDEILGSDNRPAGEVLRTASLSEVCEVQAVISVAATNEALTLAKDDRALELVTSARESAPSAGRD